MSETPRTDAKEEETELQKAQTHAYYGWKWARYLEKQLAERDSALARCVEALTYYANSRKIYSGDGLWIYAEQVICSTPASAQATAKVLAAARNLELTWNGFTIFDLEAAENALIEAIREEQKYRSSDNS